MPSKAINAVESQAATVQSGSGRNSVTDSTNESSQLPSQILAIVQHKFRNLEKRKKKLDEYKKIGESNLKNDQREALRHFGEVVLLLDLLSDMKRQFETTFNEHETLLRRQAKADKIVQRKRDIERMREVVDIRFVLNSLRNDNLRNELLQADKVSDDELLLIDKFYETVEVKVCDSTTEQQLVGATDCFERVLRKEEKLFYEKHTYSSLRSVFSRIYQILTEKTQHESVQQQEQDVEETAQQAANEVEGNSKTVPQVQNEENFENSSPQKSSQLQEQLLQTHQDKEVPIPPTKLEEIVKPGSFSFLQESQISLSGNQQGQHRQAGITHEFANSNTDQQIGQWVPQPTVKHESDDQVWSNRNSGMTETTRHEQHSGGRNRNDRGGNRQHHGRNRKHYNATGGADENNEAASTGWPQNDADYSQWKPDDAGAFSNRDSGGWIGQEPRRRSGAGGRGGRGGFHRGQSSGQQFGDNRRHFNRAPRTGGSMQQRSAAVNAGGSGFAE